jgi:hypothetical protein
VTITKPYFRVIDPQSLLEEDYSFVPLEDDPDFEVSGDVLREFILLSSTNTFSEPRSRLLFPIPAE